MDQSLSRRKFFKLAAGAAALAAGAPVVAAGANRFGVTGSNVLCTVGGNSVARAEWHRMLWEFRRFKDTEGVPVWKEGS